MTFVRNYFLLGVLLIFCVVSIFLIQGATIEKKFPLGNHLVLLGASFARGEVFLSPFGRPTTDIVDIGGRQYLYFGPLPSIIAAPFVKIFGQDWPQTYFGLGSLILTFIAVYLIGRRNGYLKPDSLWLAIFFCFSSVFFGVAILGMSSYVVQAVGVALIMWSLAEFFGKRRYFLIGILIAAAGLTRMILYLSIVFYLLILFKEKAMFRKAVLLMLPIILSVLLLGAYNYKRFRSPFESGYRLQTTALSYPMSKNILPGMFSLYHVPTNLYALLVQAPEPVLDPRGGFMVKFPFLKANPWGMAIWFTSPLFLCLFLFKSNKYTFSSGLATLILAIPSLVYFGVGYSQFGYRYSLDFLPFLFVFLLPILGSKLNYMHKLLIIIGVIFNCLYLTSLFGVYPHFGVYG